MSYENASPQLTWPRRRFLVTSAGVVAGWAVAGCGRSKATSSAVGPNDESVRLREAERVVPNAGVQVVELVAGIVNIDLAGRTVRTIAYGDSVPGREIRVRKGDQLEIRLRNELGSGTTVHWHGLAIRNDMDGVPDLTQAVVADRTTFTYRFIVPDAGTYWFHPHMGLDLDRGMYAPLIVEDPAEPVAYDTEATLVLDDWLDGIDGASPASVFQQLQAGAGMAGMGHGAMHGSGSMTMNDMGDVVYPLHLINGRPPPDAPTFQMASGARARLRVINAGSDTVYRLAIGGHPMTVTHLDGFPVEPLVVDTVVVGMGERVDVLVDAQSRVWPVVAAAEGKRGAALAWLRTIGSAAATPLVGDRLAEHDRRLLTIADARATEPVALPSASRRRTIDVPLTGGMAKYEWGIGGRVFGDHRPIEVEAGERVELRFRNHTPMVHPMHLHGHTFALAEPRGARKDTLLVGAMETMSVEFIADNPGQWMLHCHNTYTSRREWPRSSPMFTEAERAAPFRAVLRSRSVTRSAARLNPPNLYYSRADRIC